MEEQVKTDNELIAEFMGMTFNARIGSWEDDRCAFTKHSLKYDTSWDWLMPVVKKITDIDMRICDGDLIAIVKHKSVTEMLKTLDIQIVHKAVVTFIKWYNSISPQVKNTEV